MITLDDWIRIKAEDERKQSERSGCLAFTASRWYERITMFGYGMMRYNIARTETFGPIMTLQSEARAPAAQPDSFSAESGGWSPAKFPITCSFSSSPIRSKISGNTHVLTMRDGTGLEF